MKMNKIAFLASLFCLTLTACNGGGGSNNNSQPSSEPESSSAGPVVPDNAVNVFVLSGQSNMEGNTSFSSGGTDLVAQAFQQLGLSDPETCTGEGMSEVLTSTYCAGYGQLDKNNLHNNRSVNATNTEDQIMGKFVPTKTGLGSGTSKMGPELGAAYILRNYATAEKPIFFIKMASNGSGFAQSGTDYNWPVMKEDGTFPEVNMYHTFAKPFIENNLQLIKDMGFEPIIRAWMWHQGESDSASEKIPVYSERLGNMLDLFRGDFGEYALYGDANNIAFIDGMIYQGSGTAWGAQTSVQMNEGKQRFADADPSHYIVDIYANEEAIPENELKPGNPGGDSMHYNAISCLRLGMAYGRIISENGLLDFYK